MPALHLRWLSRLAGATPGGDASSSALQLIAAALSPVVLVSAAALLAVGISQKHSALGDRIRALAAELRQPGLTPLRRESLEAQLGLFAVRIRHAGRAHRLMYLAIGFFLAMILVIAFQARRPVAWAGISLALFVGGVLLMLCGIAFEWLELRLADRTIDRELSDGPPQSG